MGLGLSLYFQSLVALLAEGVDRNGSLPPGQHHRKLSPSSRRAWIEIPHVRRLEKPQKVALLAEGVDRNSLISYTKISPNRSPSSRRAWIEITRTVGGMPTRSGRPPRGGRG